MVDMKSLLRFFDRDFAIKTYLVLLLFSLLMIVDGFVLVYLSEQYGVFLVLAVEAAFGLFGGIIVLDAINRQLGMLRKKIHDGVYPHFEYCSVAACMAAGLLIVIPGFASDAVGVIILIPGVRYLVGMGLTAPLRSRLREAYEYLKMHEFENTE